MNVGAGVIPAQISWNLLGGDKPLPYAKYDVKQPFALLQAAVFLRFFAITR